MRKSRSGAVQGTDPQQPAAGLSRRRLFGLAGAGAAGAAVAGVTGGAIGRATTGEPAPAARSTAADAVPFPGPRQAGIVTPQQDRLHFVAFDVTTDDRDRLVRLLQDWTAAARRITAGQDAGPVGAVPGSQYAVPDDTGEAIGLPASGLTLTIGFGPTLFRTADGVDRFGLADRRPAQLRELPAFQGEELDPAISGGDLCVQACANDPQVAVHAVRNLARLGLGVVTMRWSQLGFGRTSSTSTGQATPRNLFGMKDGTDDLEAEKHRHAGPVRLGRRRRRTGLAHRRLLPGDPADPDGDRDLGPPVAAGPGADDRPHQGHRRPAGPAGGVRPGRLHHAGGRRVRHPGDLARLPRPPDQLRDGDPAARLQLRGRLRLARPAGRRAVLHLLPARPGDRVRAGPAQPAHRRAQRVHPAHVLGGVRLPARVTGCDDWWGRALFS